jgi:hypothetical protein
VAGAGVAAAAKVGRTVAGLTVLGAMDVGNSAGRPVGEAEGGLAGGAVLLGGLLGLTVGRMAGGRVRCITGAAVREVTQMGQLR